MTEPKKWRDMTPEEKGALLLAHHEGKGIELLLHGGRWAEAGPAWDSDICYRVKPPEPRVWWLVVDKWGDVKGEYHDYEQAVRDAYYVTEPTFFRVVE